MHALPPASMLDESTATSSPGWRIRTFSWCLVSVLIICVRKLMRVDIPRHQQPIHLFKAVWPVYAIPFQCQSHHGMLAAAYVTQNNTHNGIMIEYKDELSLGNGGEKVILTIMAMPSQMDPWYHTCSTIVMLPRGVKKSEVGDWYFLSSLPQLLIIFIRSTNGCVALLILQLLTSNHCAGPCRNWTHLAFLHCWLFPDFGGCCCLGCSSWEHGDLHPPP